MPEVLQKEPKLPRITRKVRLKDAINPLMGDGFMVEIDRLVFETSKLWLFSPLLLFKMILTHVFLHPVFQEPESLELMVLRAFSASVAKASLKESTQDQGEQTVGAYEYFAAQFDAIVHQASNQEPLTQGSIPVNQQVKQATNKRKSWRADLKGHSPLYQRHAKAYLTALKKHTRITIGHGRWTTHMLCIFMTPIPRRPRMEPAWPLDCF